jgi:hypothetical protein
LKPFPLKKNSYLYVIENSLKLRYKDNVDDLMNFPPNMVIKDLFVQQDLKGRD